MNFKDFWFFLDFCFLFPNAPGIHRMRRVFGIGFPSASWRQIWRNGQSWWSSGCHPRFATLSAQPTGRNWSYGRIMFSVEGTLFGFIGIRSHDCFLIWSVNAKRRMTGASHFQNSTGMRNEARKILRSRCSALAKLVFAGWWWKFSSA